MNHDTFYDAACKIFNYINNQIIIPINEQQINYNDFSEYIKNNPMDMDVIHFKCEFSKYIMDCLNKKGFINSLYYNDQIKYGKYLEMYENFPINNEDMCVQYYRAIFDYSSKLYDVVKKMFSFCGELGINSFNDYQINIINNYLSDNEALNWNIKDSYDSYNNEISYYYNSFNNVFYDDFYLFKNNKMIDANIYGRDLSNYDFITNYQNKKLGNIGEWVCYNNICNNINSQFVSRDLGNGFGYDLYHNNINNGYVGEVLYEVKSTANVNGDDVFSLSKNEYQKMLDCLNLPLSDYYVYRVIFDNVNRYCYPYNLKYNNSNDTFYLQNDVNNVMYEVDNDNNYGSILYKRYVPKNMYTMNI